jgi:hypothetical protein
MTGTFLTQPGETSTSYPGYNQRPLLMLALGNMALIADMRGSKASNDY